MEAKNSVYRVKFKQIKSLENTIKYLYNLLFNFNVDQRCYFTFSVSVKGKVKIFYLDNVDFEERSILDLLFELVKDEETAFKVFSIEFLDQIINALEKCKNDLIKTAIHVLKRVRRNKKTKGECLECLQFFKVFNCISMRG